MTTAQEQTKTMSRLDRKEEAPAASAIAESRLDRDPQRLDEAWSMISTYANALEQKTLTVPEGSGDLEQAITARIGNLDKELSSGVNDILHHPKFQELEAHWRGLHYLVRNTATSAGLQLQVLNVSKQELRKDVAGKKITRSVLYKKVYSEEYGILGGEPFSAIVGDFAFGRHPEDLDLLAALSHIAAAAHAPLLAAPSPDLLNMDSWTQLEDQLSLPKLFDEPGYATWRSFRESDDARYVGLVLPRMLLRLPYGPDGTRVEGFSFEEDLAGEHNRYLWGNAAYALASRMTDAFALHKWCAAIRGVQGGGLVEDLPLHSFLTGAGDLAIKCPIEISLTGAQDTELSELGFIPLVHYKKTDQAVFMETRSCHKSALYDTPEANANASLSTQLQYILAVSRFAHYLQVITRDMIGSFKSHGEMEDILNRWINQYVLHADYGSQEMKARHPLREARVEVIELPERPGVYHAVCYLRPHFQLNGLTIALRLVAQLPPRLGSQ